MAEDEEDGGMRGLCDEDYGAAEEDEYSVVARILDSFLDPQGRHHLEFEGAAAVEAGVLSNKTCSGESVEKVAEEEDLVRLESRGTREMVVMEMHEFVVDMKRKSARRLKVLEQNKLSPEELEKITKGLETIAMLDAKLQELERRSNGATPASENSSSSRASDSTAARRLRDERKRRRRYAKLKRSLENLDALNPGNQAHIIRNIVMGPNARYFTLTPEEEAMVEELLQQQDLVDDDADSNSLFSHGTTAFDVEGQEAVRLAEIDCKLDPYKESHSYCSASPLASASTPSSKAYLGYASSLASASTPTKSYLENVQSLHSGSFPGELARHHDVLSKALEPLAGTTAVEDYLVELKERREYEEKMEEIDKKLRQLQTAEVPATITEDEISQLLIDSKKEQELHAAIQ